MKNSKHQKSSEQSEMGSIDSSNKNISFKDIRSIRSIHPLGMRVVVRIRKDEERTDSGLYLPEGAKEASQESILGEVLEVARAYEVDQSGEEEEVNVSGIPSGALVLLPKDAGIRVPWDENLRILDTKNILAIVTEVDVF